MGTEKLRKLINISTMYYILKLKVMCSKIEEFTWNTFTKRKLKELVLKCYLIKLKLREIRKIISGRRKLKKKRRDVKKGLLCGLKRMKQRLQQLKNHNQIYKH